MRRFLTTTACALLACAASAEENMEGTGHTDYFGHKNCVVLENADARVC